jgi:hypothetical protein
MVVVLKYFQMEIDSMEYFKMIKLLHLYRNKFIFWMHRNSY